MHTSRFHLASHTGAGEEAAFELWSSGPRDEFSDCEACEARERGVYWQDRGEDARALLEWKPVLEQGLGCAEEPASTISHALLSLVREGEFEQAAALHRSGYRTAKAEVGMDVQVGRHLEFLALTGNGARGLELLAENRGRFDSTTDPLSRLYFLDGVRVLLARLVAEGAAEAPVTGPGGRTYTVASLLAEVTATSDELARRFDERNGTSCQGDFHRERCARGPLSTEPLPLGIRVTPLSSAPTLGERAAGRDAPGPRDAAGRGAGGAPAGLGRTAARSGRSSRGGPPRQTSTTSRGPNSPTGRHSGTCRSRSGTRPRPARARQSAELFEQADELGRALARRARAEWCGFMAARPEDVASLSWSGFDSQLAAAERAAGFRADRDRGVHVVRHSRAASALKVLMSANKESAAQARARFDAENEALLEAAMRLGELARAAVAEGMRSTVLAGAGDAEEALTAVESAIALAKPRAQRPWSLPQYLGQQGQLLNRLGRLHEAAPVLHRALALLAEWPDEDIDELAILMELAQNRLHAEDYDAAATHLSAAAARFDRRREDLAAAHARALLGQALVHGRRVADAVAVFESLLTEEAEAELDVHQRAQIRLDFGRALMQTGEPREAAEVFARLADLVTDWPDPSPCTSLVAGELVCALYPARLWEQGEQAIARALEVHESAPNPAMICKMLRVAAQAEYENRGAPPGVDRALEMLRRGDEVNEAAKEIAGHYRRWPETALNADLRVQALGSVGRNEQALTACDQAIEAWLRGGDQTIGEYAQAVQIAAIIEADRLGRKQDALARLSPAITRCR